jgi:hypothetical protein
MKLILMSLFCFFRDGPPMKHCSYLKCTFWYVGTTWVIKANNVIINSIIVGIHGYWKLAFNWMQFTLEFFCCSSKKYYHDQPNQFQRKWRQFSDSSWRHSWSILLFLRFSFFYLVIFNSLGSIKLLATTTLYIVIYSLYVEV